LLKSFKNKNRILIIRLSSLGDILLTTPLIRSLKNQSPNLTVDFLLKTQYRDVLKRNPYITNLYLYENLGKNNDSEGFELRKGNYDLIIDLQNNFRSRKTTRLLKTQKVIFNKHNFDKFLIVHFKINRLLSLPQIPVRYARSLQDFSLDEDGLDLFLPDGLTSNISDSKKYIAFAPGSRHYTKMWPIEYFVQLGKLIIRDGYKIVLLGGSNDRMICDKLKEKLPDAENLCGKNKLFQTASDMKNCSALVCNDSGLMHVACALKIPVLVFFGSTVKDFGFTPYRNNNLILENNYLTCRPCSHIGRNSCPKKHFKCMKEITPEFAFNKLKELLTSK